MNSPHWEVIKDQDRGYKWVLKASNGKAVARSSTNYVKRSHALNSIVVFKNLVSQYSKIPIKYS